MVATKRPLLAALTDKRFARRFAARHGVPVPQNFFAGSHCSAVPSVSQLPQSFVFKAAHIAGCVLLVERGRIKSFKPCYSGQNKMTSAVKIGDSPSDKLLRSLCRSWSASGDRREEPCVRLCQSRSRRSLL